jgi:hypothetical protein
LNPSFSHTEHAWVLEDINHLQHYSSTNLQTWIYEAKVLSGLNQQQIKHQFKQNRSQKIWNQAKTSPIMQPIEKCDLDPGERDSVIPFDC